MKKIVAVATAFFVLCAETAVFAATMDSKVRSVPQPAIDLVFKKPKEGLPQVVKYLTANASNIPAKVKVMHDWICDNIAYDTDMYFSGRVSKQDYESVLKKKKAVCSGYASLMNEMCRLAGIESVGVHGYSKGFGYRGKLDRSDHEWNAINYGNKWQLVDICWDAGFVDYKTFIKRYSTEWLYRTPEQFIYSHLPEKNEFQYLKEIKTKEQFVQEPYIAGIFFDYGLALGKSSPNYSNQISGETLFDFKLNKTGVSVIADLYERDGANELVPNAIWTDRIGSKVTVNVDVPNERKHTVYLYARNRGAIMNPYKFYISEFEQDILPRAQQLVADKKATQTEYDFLASAYFKVTENGWYYLAEDLFAYPRNNAVTKILKLLDENTGSFDNVFHFDISAADDYAGFGDGVVKFPTTYRSYNETSNTHVISPIAGILQAGTSARFEVESQDFIGIGIVIGGQIVPFTKNGNRFELETEIPADIDTLAVYGSRNGKNYTGLWFYKVEKIKNADKGKESTPTNQENKESESANIQEKIPNDCIMPYAEICLLYEMYEEAEQVLKTGAELGNTDAMRLLGIMYFENKVDDKAFYWLNKSAVTENPVSQDQLGLCYVHGVGTNVNKQKAIELFTKAAETGYPMAAQHLAYTYIFEIGLDEIPTDAKPWIEKEASKGNLEALNFLGNMYNTGKGVAKDQRKAVEIYKDLVNKNYVYGYTNLALCYLHGYGVEKDAKKAKEYLEQAANMGSQEALDIMENEKIK